MEVIEFTWLVKSVDGTKSLQKHILMIDMECVMKLNDLCYHGYILKLENGQKLSRGFLRSERIVRIFAKYDIWDKLPTHFHKHKNLLSNFTNAF
jgi:hypothetical protein